MRTIAIDARKLQDFGIGTYIRNLLRHLSELDTENRYLLLVRPEDEGKLQALGPNFETVVERSPVYSLRELAALSWRLMRLRVDLYHATHYVLPAFIPCPVVVTIHDIIHLLFPGYLPNRMAHIYARQMIRRALKYGQRIIVVSRNTKDDLLAYFDVDPDKIDVVYQGVDTSFRDRLGEEDLHRWLTTLGLEQPYLLFVGNPKPHKNLDNVVQAYARALKIGDFQAPLVCVGGRDGSDFKVRQRATNLGIADQVKLLGHVAQEALPALFQGASVFLYPTLYEGFGLPVVEAMASGTPVLTSNTSALYEIANGFAHLVDPLDVEEMAKGIAHLMRDEQYRRSLRELGLERAADFDWRRTAEQTLDIYRQVLDQ